MALIPTKSSKEYKQEEAQEQAIRGHMKYLEGYSKALMEVVKLLIQSRK
jgi:hypothetical protein